MRLLDVLTGDSGSPGIDFLVIAECSKKVQIIRIDNSRGIPFSSFYLAPVFTGSLVKYTIHTMIIRAFEMSWFAS